MFWSSVDLTGNQTSYYEQLNKLWFWSSVDLTGNQTGFHSYGNEYEFWSSVDLTGNQTENIRVRPVRCFGAVSI